MSPRVGPLRRRFRSSSLNNRSLGESVVIIFITCTIRGVFHFFVPCFTLGIFLPLRLEA